MYFSIIIPSYNRCELLKNCIEKLKNQQFDDWECIIINDGSTDHTQEDISDFIKNSPQFKLVYQENSERAIARNNGVKHAQGKYLIFLDSDDYFEDDHLKNLHQFIFNDQEKVGMYFTNAQMSINNKNQLIHSKEYTPLLDFSYFIENSVIPARVCIHHKIMQHLSFDPRTIIVEDTVLWTEIFDLYPITYIPISSVIYQIHDTNSVNLNFNNAYLQRLKGLKVLFLKKGIGSKIPYKTKQKQLNRCYLGISEYYFIHGKNTKSKYWLIKSLIRFPFLETKYKLKVFTTNNFGIG
jgi:glycosyltransferase involved in cell wall biosynthesis